MTVITRCVYRNVCKKVYPKDITIWKKIWKSQGVYTEMFVRKCISKTLQYGRKFGILKLVL